MTPEIKKFIEELTAEGLGRPEIRKRIQKEFGVILSDRQVRKAQGKNPDASRENDKKSFSESALMAENAKKYDPNATEEEMLGDLRRVQEMFPGRHITQNHYWLKGLYSFSTYTAKFGNFEEFRRQARLQVSRGQHKMQREIAKHASLDVYREFYNEEILPYIGCYERDDNGKTIKVMVVGSDFHDIEADPFVLALFIDTCRRLQPDIIILNGDVFDLYEFSRFDIDPRRANVAERFKFVREMIFAKLREVCPNAQIDFVLGNHEWRFLKLFADRTSYLKVVLSEVMGLTLEDVFGVHEYEINLICKWDLAAFMQRDMTQQVKENYKIYYGAFVAAHLQNYKFGVSGTSGHTHKPSTDHFWNIHGKHTWVVTPCIAKTPVEYREGPDIFMNGFNIVFVDTVTKQVQQELIIIPGDFAAIAGKLYTRRSFEMGKL